MEKRRFEIMSSGRANTSEGLQALAKHPNDGASLWSLQILSSIENKTSSCAK